jgi:hypothetical protein
MRLFSVRSGGEDLPHKLCNFPFGSVSSCHLIPEFAGLNA